MLLLNLLSLVTVARLGWLFTTEAFFFYTDTQERVALCDTYRGDCLVFLAECRALRASSSLRHTAEYVAGQCIDHGGSLFYLLLATVLVALLKRSRAPLAAWHSRQRLARETRLYEEHVERQKRVKQLPEIYMSM